MYNKWPSPDPILLYIFLEDLWITNARPIPLPFIYCVLTVPVRSKLRSATVPPKMLRLLAVDIAALPETVVLVDQVISATPRPVRFDAEKYRIEKDDGAGRYHNLHQVHY